MSNIEFLHAISSCVLVVSTVFAYRGFRDYAEGVYGYGAGDVLALGFATVTTAAVIGIITK